MNSILIGIVAGCPDCVNGRCISGRRAQKWIANGRNDVGYAKHDRTPGAGRAVAGVMQDMKEMMRWMSKMMDMCTEMMSHVSQSTKDETSK